MRFNFVTSGTRWYLSGIIALCLAAPVSAYDWGLGNNPAGAYTLALDAAPYGLPPGTMQPGLLMINADRTAQILDGGDFGGLPFNMRDSNQFGAWYRSRGHINIVTLFLQADAVGDLQYWYRVHIKVKPVARDTLGGIVNVFQLKCTLPAPFAAFSCPDTIENAGDFVPVDGPSDVPVTFRRFRPQGGRY